VLFNRPTFDNIFYLQWDQICKQLIRDGHNSPIVTSVELWVSNRRFSCCHSNWIHCTIWSSRLHSVLSLTDDSAILRRKYRPRKPCTGSIWFAHKTHRKLWWSWRLVVDPVAWFIVPIMYGLQIHCQGN